MGSALPVTFDESCPVLDRVWAIGSDAARHREGCRRGALKTTTHGLGGGVAADSTREVSPFPAKHKRPSPV